MEDAKFNPKIYKDISLDELVTYCVYILHEEKSDATFEDIVAKCFILFPERFCLTGYAHWPDAARVNKSWLRCRTDFKYITGSVKRGFKVTSKGLAVVEKVQDCLMRPRNERIALKKKKIRERTKEELFLNNLRKSDAYKLYVAQGEDVEIPHYDFCNMLFGTIESSVETLNENLNMLRNYALKLGDKEILDFLEKVEARHPHYLNSNEKSKKKYVGGMFKKSARRRK
jgi:hypothetical protein